MIVKYFNAGTWGYIDGVRQAAVKSIDYDKLIKAYNECERYKDCDYAGQFDIASYSDGEKKPADIAALNKVYLMAIDAQSDLEYNSHAENMLDAELMAIDVPAVVVLLYLEDCKEYDSMALVTNQRCFLMNDKGQTVDRLA